MENMSAKRRKIKLKAFLSFFFWHIFDILKKKISFHCEKSSNIHKNLAKNEQKLSSNCFEIMCFIWITQNLSISGLLNIRSSSLSPCTELLDWVIFPNWRSLNLVLIYLREKSTCSRKRRLMRHWETTQEKNLSYLMGILPEYAWYRSIVQLCAAAQDVTFKIWGETIFNWGGIVLLLIHSNLDIANKSVRPFLYTISNNSLYQR